MSSSTDDTLHGSGRVVEKRGILLQIIKADILLQIIKTVIVILCAMWQSVPQDNLSLVDPFFVELSTYSTYKFCDIHGI